MVSLGQGGIRSRNYFQLEYTAGIVGVCPVDDTVGRHDLALASLYVPLRVR